MFKISIVTPSYNSAKFMEDCIQSVLNQNYPNFEQIIIDGGSTDGTIEILKKYSHLKWISEPDNGQSDAINKGFNLATGDLVGWLNADDYYLPGTFDLLNKYFFYYPDFDIYYGERVRVDKNKHIIKHQKDHDFDFGVLLYDYCYISSTATFFKKQILTKEFVNVNFKILMDLELYVRLYEKGYRFKFIPVALAHFRIHDDNVSLNNEERRKKERYMIQKTYGKNPFSIEYFNKLFFKVIRPIFKLRRIYLKIFQKRSLKYENNCR